MRTFPEVNEHSFSPSPRRYIILQPDANRIVRSGVVPEMRDADVTKPGKTIWYFDRVPDVERCFEHTVRRYYPVANLTRTRQVGGRKKKGSIMMLPFSLLQFLLLLQKKIFLLLLVAANVVFVYIVDIFFCLSCCCCCCGSSSRSCCCYCII